MADGGEGTLHSLVGATNGKIFSAVVVGPLGVEIEAQYGILGDGETGVIEMASASGLHLVPIEKRNPLLTTTYGTGQLIKICLEKGVKKLMIAIGGSATNDGGVGAMQALGAKFLNVHGNEIGFGGGALADLAQIDLTDFDKRIEVVTVDVACDVNNPLCGENGASKVFGPQKGATPQMVKILDQNLLHYAQIIEKSLHINVLNTAGAGAAGGMGAGLMAFMNGNLKKGIELVIDYTQLETKVKNADMVWTGEGRIDFQTQFGKTPFGVAQTAKQFDKPVVVLAGSIGENLEMLYTLGFNSIFSITNGDATLDEALKNGISNLERTAENVIRLLQVGI
jgi:glycerate kinase